MKCERALALGTGASVEQAIRFLAAFSGLGSLVQIIAAFIRRHSTQDTFSEWDEAIVLGIVSAGAHLIANLIQA